MASANSQEAVARFLRLNERQRQEGRLKTRGARDMKKALAHERQGFFSWRLLQAYIGQRNDNADCRDGGGYCVD